MDDWVPLLRDVRFPQYPVGSETDLEELLSTFHRDFWNSLGKHSNTDDVRFSIGT